VCGRSCVRDSCCPLCCGAKLVPLPVSRAGTPGCGRGRAAPELGLAGEKLRTEVRGKPREPSPPNPHPNGRRRARRARGASPTPPPGARGRARRVREPRPTATRGGSEPWPPPGPQSDLGDLGASRSLLASVSRPPSTSRAGLSFLSPPALELHLGPDLEEAFIWDGGCIEVRGVFKAHQPEVQGVSKEGAACAWRIGDSNS
jgi:hypothetical protein